MGTPSASGHHIAAKAGRSRETQSVRKRSGSACLAGSRTSLLAVAPLVVAGCCRGSFSAGVVAAMLLSAAAPSASVVAAANDPACQPKGAQNQHGQGQGQARGRDQRADRVSRSLPVMDCRRRDRAALQQARLLRRRQLTSLQQHSQQQSSQLQPSLLQPSLPLERPCVPLPMTTARSPGMPCSTWACACCSLRIEVLTHSSEVCRASSSEVRVIRHLWSTRCRKRLGRV